MTVRDDELLPIGTIAQRSGVNASALRYYESLGLIESVRSNAGHRRYRRSTLRRVAYVVFAQRLGFQLEEISGQLNGLPKHHAPTGDEWNSLSQIWIHRVDERMQDLMHLRKSLEKCIGCGCLSMKVCDVFNRADCIAENGVGPRSWLGDTLTRSESPDDE
ncbi:redox-sensitive transcriptional activator SoxR [Diaphorobacter aerolatus]|uniref:Redox-sensitive transcriptional activator SoxR n=1 Tax=Diaphorobacter aerolatus TaxID=1288495 RepID=A0A7H0GL62_9BURK|nr:redox-sensitive transcriptional activator SoxR [Diaphorobacter aerolatus]QNP49028.1 redox-sensitive transcriptional activator SoxR [Diaphorobacter aerolatus]